MAAALSSAGWPKVLAPFVSRPHLIVAAVVGLCAYGVALIFAHSGVTRGLVGWDVGVVAFVGLSLAAMVDVDHEHIKRRAIHHDEGRHVILGLTLAATLASLSAIVTELGRAKGHAGIAETLRVGLTISTIALSWLLVQVVFAIHYAHVFYATEERGGPHKGGLIFPDQDDPPDYWDFIYFSATIGATSQTADISIASKELRRVATIHGLIAFSFNTAILATMINLAAGLF
jgi:uncharacterized membrane protein